MNIPNGVSSASLFARLSEDEELKSALLLLRKNSSSLAETISRSVPTFTDHSVRHMDALWQVADRVLTEVEIEQLSPAEAFLIGSGFYLHDIGMAYAATSDGLAKIRASSPYKSVIASTLDETRTTADTEARAIAFAVRKVHANAAEELATNPVPGTDIYLMEPREIREAWGPTCGKVAASHHWHLDQLDRQLGRLELAPLPGGRRGDIAYAACILRVVDFAHINRDRAPTIDRAFRSTIQEDSLVHWLAQESIDGPDRVGAYLSYRCASQISDINAWWLYYDMLRGLDAEIQSVRRYLERREVSRARFSLEGVRGSESPEEASRYIPPLDFLPIEVNVRAGSLERLVQLLAGESLYGPDPMAAVRELIQNARDAVELKTALASSAADKALLALPIRIALDTKPTATLEVVDWGIGMTKTVMTDYLITLASDYWESQFHHDFPGVVGFQPAGKFGIGFLSVFMLGQDVWVESNRASGARLALALNGVGRRGQLKEATSQPGSGSSIRVQLKDGVLEKLNPLLPKVKAYAPYLSHPLEVSVDGEKHVINPGWVNELSSPDFRRWVIETVQLLMRSRDRVSFDLERQLHRVYALGRGTEKDMVSKWTIDWPEYRDRDSRFVASFEGVTILCLKGLTLQSVSTPGFVGIVNLDSVTPDASRRHALDADLTDVIERARDGMTRQVVANLDALSERSFVVHELGFLASCVKYYGRQVLLESSIRWISEIRLPGDVRSISCTDFSNLVRANDSVFVIYNTGPWTGMKNWAANRSSGKANEIAIVLDGNHDGVGSPGYVASEDERIGSLSSLWPKCDEGLLFGTMLGIVAEAWQRNVRSLIDQDGWHHEGSSLWGRLERI